MTLMHFGLLCSFIYTRTCIYTLKCVCVVFVAIVNAIYTGRMWLLFCCSLCFHCCCSMCNTHKCNAIVYILSCMHRSLCFPSQINKQQRRSNNNNRQQLTCLPCLTPTKPFFIYAMHLQLLSQFAVLSLSLSHCCPFYSFFLRIYLFLCCCSCCCWCFV